MKQCLCLNMKVLALCLTASLFLWVFHFEAAAQNADAPQTLNLMPVPEKISLKETKFRIGDDFNVSIVSPKGVDTLRSSKAMNRLLRRLSDRTGIFFKSHAVSVSSSPSPTSGGVTVHFERYGQLKLHEDETYRLEVKPEGIAIDAVTDIGILRGMETLLQLLDADFEGYYFPAVVIEDKPRFPWRGLLIDPCRHFLPVAVIKRNLDAMAAVKLNVLHWHLSEDQGFRIECKTFPKLHQLGSDGFYYTQEQVKDVIAYAADRGIRVMPEFDIPGHSTSWAVAFPQLMSAPGPYSIERKHGIFDPTFDPTKKETYKFFSKFFKEMCALFPDEYMHIGGDENNGKQWSANPAIQAFMKKKNIKDNHQLQAYFNKKILPILTRNGKKMMGWDEIFQPGLPKTIVIQSWRGKKALLESAERGYDTLLSNGYYIDLSQRTDTHYLNDPLPAGTALTPEQCKHILGGEATMWAELITQRTVDSRIWPRTAAIAERFWSPASVNDVRDMYRRLDSVSLQLEEHGVTHLKNADMILRGLSRGEDIRPLQVLLGVVAPLKDYKRHNQTTYTSFSPFTRLVDAAVPDPVPARKFRFLVEDYLKTPTPELKVELMQMLEVWRLNHLHLNPIINTSPILKEAQPLSEALWRVACVGIAVLNKAGDTQKQEELLKTCAKPAAHAEIVIIPEINKLLQARK